VGEISPLNQKIKKMKFPKKTLLENLNIKSNGVKTFSEKPQSVIVTESQLERIIAKLLKKK
jgi:hypothetical protein